MCCVADYKRGFGGQYGVQVERQDQCALGYEHKENLAKHESQKGTDTPDPQLPVPKTLFPLCCFSSVLFVPDSPSLLDLSSTSRWRYLN